MLHHVPGICDSDQQNGFTCPNGRTVFSSSVVWGAIGPSRFYSIGQIYSSLLHFFWIGALLPVITWAIYKKTGSKKEWIRLINWPLIFVGTYNVPPATGINYSTWALVNIVFNWFVYKKFFAWWTKYNYILAAALDTGLALSALIIFFCITYMPRETPTWSSTNAAVDILEEYFRAGGAIQYGRPLSMALECPLNLCLTADILGRRMARGIESHARLYIP